MISLLEKPHKHQTIVLWNAWKICEILQKIA